MRLFDLSSRTLVSLLVLGAVATTGVASAAMLSSSDEVATVAASESTPSAQGSGADGFPTEAQASTLAEQKQEYDPAEVQFLLKQAADANYGRVTDQDLVSVLEFRNACRQVVAAATAAEAAGPDKVASSVDAIMDAEVARLTARTPSDSESAAFFDGIAQRIKAGESSAVVQQLRDADCRDALKWTG